MSAAGSERERRHPCRARRGPRARNPSSSLARQRADAPGRRLQHEAVQALPRRGVTGQPHSPSAASGGRRDPRAAPARCTAARVTPQTARPAPGTSPPARPDIGGRVRRGQPTAVGACRACLVERGGRTGAGADGNARASKWQCNSGRSCVPGTPRVASRCTCCRARGQRARRPGKHRRGTVSPQRCSSDVPTVASARQECSCRSPANPTGQQQRHLRQAPGAAVDQPTAPPSGAGRPATAC